MKESFEGMMKPSRARLEGEQKRRDQDEDNIIPINDARYKKPATHISLTGTRPSRASGDFVRSIKQQVPEGFNFDAVHVPKETLTALRSAGLIVRPYEKNGEYFLEVDDGVTKETLRHSEAIEWLQGIVSQYDADAHALSVAQEKVRDLTQTEAIHTELERIDRETLIATLSQWYDNVTLDETKDLITMTRREDGFVFEVSYDDVQELINNNGKLDTFTILRDQGEAHRSTQRTQTTGTELPSSSSERDRDEYTKVQAPPDIVMKALSQVYTKKVELSEDGKSIILQSEHNEPFSIRVAQAPMIIAANARLQASHSVDAFGRRTRGPSQKMNPVRVINEKNTLTDAVRRPFADTIIDEDREDVYDGTERALNKVLAREKKNWEELLKNGDFPNVRVKGQSGIVERGWTLTGFTDEGEAVVMRAPDDKPNSTSRFIEKRIPLKEFLVENLHEPVQRSTHREKPSNVEALRQESMQRGTERDELEAPSTEGLEVSEVDIDTLSPHEREALGLSSDTTVESTPPNEPTPPVAPSPNVGGMIDVGALNPPPRWQGGGAVPPPEAPRPPQQPPQREGGTPPPTPPPPVGEVPRTPPPPEGPRGDVKKIREQIRVLEEAKSNVSYTSREFRNTLLEHYPSLAREWKSVASAGDAAQIVWLENKLAELKTTERGAGGETSSFFDRRFEQYGVTDKDLESIPGYENLSPEHRMLVFENFRDYVKDTEGGIGKHLWSSVRSAFGNTRDQKLTSSPFDAPSFERHKDILTTLVGITERYVPKNVHIEGNEVLVGFVGYTPERRNRPEQKRVIDALNRTAHQFAKIPASHQEDGNGVHNASEWGVTTFLKEKLIGTKERQEYLAYQKKMREYDVAKKRFEAQLVADGVPPDRILEELVKVDAQVNMLRFIHTNPDAVDLLKREGDPTIWQKAGTFAVQGGIYGGLGTLSRISIAGYLGVLGGPAVAGVLSGIRSWNKTAALQRERDRRLVMGIEDADMTKMGEKRKEQTKELFFTESAKERIEISKDDAYDTRLNVVAATQTIETSEGAKEMGLTARLREKIERCKALQHETDPEGRKQYIRALRSLRGHVVYSQDKFMLNRIQYGPKETFASNREAFVLALTEAHMFFSKEIGGLSEEERVEVERLANKSREYMGKRDEFISERRNAEQWNKVRWAAGTAAVFSGAFAYLYVNHAQEHVKGAYERVSGWLGWGEDALKETSQVVEKSVEKSPSVAGARGVASTLSESVNLPKGDGGKGMETFIEKLKAAGTFTDPQLQGMHEAIASLPSEALRAIGIQSGTLDNIQAGDKINVQRFKEHLAIEDENAPYPEPVQTRDSLPPLDIPKTSPVVEVVVGKSDVDIAADIIAGGDGTQGGSPQTSGAPSGERYVQDDSPVNKEINKWFRGEKTGGSEVPQKGQSGEVINSEREMMLKEERTTKYVDRAAFQRLKDSFLTQYVPGKQWQSVKGMNVNSFIASARDPVTRVEQGRALTELGKLFDLTSREPYRVTPRQDDTVESYMRRAFLAISKGERSNINTDAVRQFLESARNGGLKTPAIPDTLLEKNGGRAEEVGAFVQGEKPVYEGLREITDHDKGRAEILQLKFLEKNVPGYEWHNKIKNMDAEAFMAAARERGGGGLSGGAQTLGRIFNTLQQPPYSVVPEERDTVDSYMRKAFAAVAQADDDKANTTEVRNFIRKNILGIPEVGK